MFCLIFKKILPLFFITNLFIFVYIYYLCCNHWFIITHDFIRYILIINVNNIIFRTFFAALLKFPNIRLLDDDVIITKITKCNLFLKIFNLKYINKIIHKRGNSINKGDNIVIGKNVVSYIIITKYMNITVHISNR